MSTVVSPLVSAGDDALVDRVLAGEDAPVARLSSGEKAPLDHVPAGEDALVDRLRAGDPDACQEMIERCGARLLRTLRRLRGDQVDVDDLLQETWIHACRAAYAFRGEASLRTWLERIAVNAAAMAQRRRLASARGAGRGDVSLSAVLDGREHHPSGMPWGIVRDVESEAIQRETLRELTLAVADLPPGLRDVFVLQDIEGASTAQAAQELGVSEDTVRQRLHRARVRLRSALEPIDLSGAQLDVR